MDFYSGNNVLISAESLILNCFLYSCFWVLYFKFYVFLDNLGVYLTTLCLYLSNKVLYLYLSSKQLSIFKYVVCDANVLFTDVLYVPNSFDHKGVYVSFFVAVVDTTPYL